MKRIRNNSAEQKQRWNLKTRYGITPSQCKEMLDRQKHVCAICQQPMSRPVIDHCHQTGKVRGVLCHHCNIKLPVIEDSGWVMLAWAYLDEA